ncbi:ATP-binding protein [Saccharomonospora xinjiangensis]|uniref:ATP-binding protein n=1 Tax=Saccharomonospora xinjiangensis TaxID=75294 RepID=UPI00107026D9|nr:ATP-binding protein [Saccharomonospora xinjiangensis]QBQ62436.1 Archaeal ATPase [Saccharomonospora xinjiangensis]
MRFLNRVDELAFLRRRLASDRAELLIVYGRRRVGKTELLNHLATEVRSFVLEATETVKHEQLADFTAELARVSGDDLLARQSLTSWDAALAAIARFVGKHRTLVVLDEFQLLAKQAPELESVLSRWWRTTGRTLPIVLVLAGSEISFFENEVLAGRLYGRRTGQLKVDPFLARDAGLFHPAYSAQDRIRAFSVCGGVPYYLDRFTDDRPLPDHLLDEVFDRGGLLHDEAELLLRQSLRDPAGHVAVLRSIADGHNRNSTIAARTGLEPATVTKLLRTLERLGLVEQQRPVTSSGRSKKTAYRVCDHFLRFHYRFVEPARTRTRTRELAEDYLRGVVLPQLDHHASSAWEDVCREHVLLTFPEASRVGRWWGQAPTGDGRRTEEREIDIVGLDTQARVSVVGMCKWTASPVDFDELNLLDRLTPFVERGAQPHRVLCSRSGFSPRLRAYAADDDMLTLLTPEDVTTAPPSTSRGA